MKNNSFVDIPKGSNEIIRVSLDKYKGHRAVSIRIWYQDEGGKLNPSKKGIWIPIQLFPDVMKAIKKAQRRAIKKGLLSPRKNRQGR